MRLIDADALLEALSKKDSEVHIGLVFQLIDSMPTIQREGWISVEDRLPENDATVICSDIPSKFIKQFKEGNYIPASDEIFGACFVKGTWTYEPYGDYESTTRVTHWQPLPAAPTDTE